VKKQGEESMGNCMLCTWNGHTIEEACGNEEIGGAEFVTRELERLVELRRYLFAGGTATS
jgi:hypothetical protein